MKTPHTWGNADFTWGDNDFIWNDVFYILQKIESAGGGTIGFNSVSKEDKKKLIKVILSLNGVDYSDSKKEFNSYTVTAEDLELVQSELTIRIDTKSIKIT